MNRPMLWISSLITLIPAVSAMALGDGACCIDGACTQTTFSECVHSGGVYLGNDMPCEDNCTIPACDGYPDAGICCLPSAFPGCDDPACCDAVCAIDPFCCMFSWDESCVAVAYDACDDLCRTLSGACCLGDGTCIETTVNECPVGDPLIQFYAGAACEDITCAAAACGATGAGSCCTDHESPGCADADCCFAVCAVDGFCCVSQWDGLCADLAFAACDGCTALGACCVAGACKPLTSVDCTAAGGTYHGDGSFCQIVSCPACPGNPACKGDFDDDTTIGVNDLLHLLSEWGGACGDVDGDGITGIGDVLELLERWGTCPA